jgi:hypothetical protein
MGDAWFVFSDRDDPPERITRGEAWRLISAANAADAIGESAVRSPGEPPDHQRPGINRNRTRSA